MYKSIVILSLYLFVVIDCVTIPDCDNNPDPVWCDECHYGKFWCQFSDEEHHFSCACDASHDSPLQLKHGCGRFLSNTLSKVSPQCKLQLVMDLPKGAKIKIFIKDKEEIMIGKLKHRTSGWDLREVFIGNINVPFQLVLEVSSSEGGIVFVGDLKLLDCAYPAPTPGVCTECQFQCDSQLCIPDYKVCDHVNDCADNSDEATCDKRLMTNFDLNFGNWRDATGLGAKIAWKSLKSLPNVAYRDHTPGVNKGSFLSPKLSPEGIHKTAYLKSPFLQPTLTGYLSKPCQLRIFYMPTENAQEPSVYYKSKVTPKVQLKGTVYDEGPWKRLVVTLCQSERFKIILGAESFADIAIDDISFSPSCRLWMDSEPQVKKGATLLTHQDCYSKCDYSAGMEDSEDNALSTDIALADETKSDTTKTKINETFSCGKKRDDKDLPPDKLLTDPDNPTGGVMEGPSSGENDTGVEPLTGAGEPLKDEDNTKNATIGTNKPSKCEKNPIDGTVATPKCEDKNCPIDEAGAARKPGQDKHDSTDVTTNKTVADENGSSNADVTNITADVLSDGDTPTDKNVIPVNDSLSGNGPIVDAIISPLPVDEEGEQPHIKADEATEKKLGPKVSATLPPVVTETDPQIVTPGEMLLSERSDKDPMDKWLLPICVGLGSLLVIAVVICTVVIIRRHKRQQSLQFRNQRTPEISDADTIPERDIEVKG